MANNLNDFIGIGGVLVPLSATQQALTDRCRADGIHLRRDVGKQATIASVEAYAVLHEHMFPLVTRLAVEIQIPWVQHTMECCKDGDWEHVVIPTVVYELYKPQFDAAGFEKAPDLRQFATQDGLKEALLGGADFNKKWE